MTPLALLLALFASSGDALAQDMSRQHVPGMSHAERAFDGDSGRAGIVEGGQSAFSAIQEIVEQVMADPATDWRRVDIESLRQHLIDMDNVTLRASVAMRQIEGGIRFEATSDEAAVIASIRAMVPAHVATVNGAEGWSMHAEEIPGGAVLTVRGGDLTRIRALGFIGVMTVGMHHQVHHLALATGQNPHAH